MLLNESDKSAAGDFLAPPKTLSTGRLHTYLKHLESLQPVHSIGSDLTSRIVFALGTIEVTFAVAWVGKTFAESPIHIEPDDSAGGEDTGTC